MNNNLFDLITTLTKGDKKSLSQKALKTTEEVGELAKVILPFENAFATTHRFVDKSRILEEIADTALCIYSIAIELGFNELEIDEMIGMKAKKWAELQARETKAKWPIPFEIHVTVRDAELESFKAACISLNVKPILLDLQNANGNTVFHDLMTSSVHMGTNPTVYNELKRISSGLRNLGFNVVREKIEAAPWHPAAPSENHLTQVMPKDCYFECHFAVITNEEKMDRLREISNENDMHLSRNIFKKLDGGFFKIMTTYRRYDGTFEKFKKSVEGIAEHLKVSGFEIDKTIVEFSVYDTKVSHDATWLMKG